MNERTHDDSITVFGELAERKDQSPILCTVKLEDVLSDSLHQKGRDAVSGARPACIWAFGCVLYECLTGKRPFHGDTVTETLASILKGEPDWKALPTATPWNVTVLLRRCLQKDPRQRLGAISDARLEIDDALTAPSAGGGATTQSGPPPARRRASWSTWAAVAVLAVAAGFGIWKLSASLALPEPRVLRLAVSIPASQGFVDVAGNAVLFTPDGSAIVYSGLGPKRSQLYYRRLDQLEGTALPGTDNACCTAISPSGDWVAFEAGFTVWKVSVSGGAPIPLAKVSYQGGISWGSDDAIYSDESGHYEVYVRPFPAGGAHVPVSADGGSDPRWEKDSHGIVYRNADRFMKARLAIGANVAVTQRDLLFPGPYSDYDLSPNGAIVALRPGSADAEIIVVTNWIAELKAKLGKK